MSELVRRPKCVKFTTTASGVTKNFYESLPAGVSHWAGASEQGLLCDKAPCPLPVRRPQRARDRHKLNAWQQVLGRIERHHTLSPSCVGRWVSDNLDAGNLAPIVAPVLAQVRDTAQQLAYALDITHTVGLGLDDPADRDEAFIAFQRATSGTDLIEPVYQYIAFVNGDLGYNNAPQLWIEWQSLQSMRKAVIVLGRGQFVDPGLIEHMLDAGFEDPAVRAWHKKGGKNPGNPDTDTLRECFPSICWLYDDLAFVAQDFPCSDCRLDEESSPEAMYWYDEARTAAQKADVIFCTHAMLALDNQLRCRNKNPSRILPVPALLMIDEAHQFESAVAAQASEGLALSRLSVLLDAKVNWTESRRATKAKAAHEACLEVIEACRMVPDDHVFTFNPRDDPYLDARLEIEFTCSVLLSRLKELSNKKLDTSTDSSVARRRMKLRSPISTLNSFLSGTERSQISFAPRRRYPTISAGPMSVRYLLVPLWQRCPAVVLFSATLTLPTVKGDIDDSYLRAVLAIPRERASSYEPIVPEWICSGVVLNLPSENTALSLTPPPRSLNEQEATAAIDEWCKHVAQVIENEVLPAAKGGTLVLVPSKDAVKGIAQHLSQAVLERCVLHSNALPVQQAKGRFIEAYRAGKYPLWIATGPAWTGLDLSDSTVSAEDDFLLTDLVIARLPFSVNRSLTQVSREQWMGYRAYLAEAMMLFKQGLGRQVRRAALTDRRLWILDGRITNPAFDARMKTANLILKRYENRRFFLMLY